MISLVLCGWGELKDYYCFKLLPPHHDKVRIKQNPQMMRFFPLLWIKMTHIPVKKMTILFAHKKMTHNDEG